MKAVLSFIHVFAHIDQPSRLANTTKQIFRHNGPTEFNMLRNKSAKGPAQQAMPVRCKASPSTGSRALPTSKTSKVEVTRSHSFIEADDSFVYSENVFLVYPVDSH